MPSLPWTPILRRRSKLRDLMTVVYSLRTIFFAFTAVWPFLFATVSSLFSPFATCRRAAVALTSVWFFD